MDGPQDGDGDLMMPIRPPFDQRGRPNQQRGRERRSRPHVPPRGPWPADRRGRLIHRGNESIPAARDRFDVSRRPCPIAQRNADLPHAVIEPFLKIHARLIAPERVNRLGPAHEVARPRHQQRQQRARLGLETMNGAFTTDLPRGGVEFERISPEAHRDLATETVRA